MNKSFLVLFSKKNKKKHFFLKKEAKTFVNCSSFDDVGWNRRLEFANAIALRVQGRALAFLHFTCQEEDPKSTPSRS